MLKNYETWNEYCDRLVQRNKAVSMPILMCFELTSNCNLCCSMCYVRLQSKQIGKQLLTGDTWLELARKAEASGVLKIMVSGGEAVTHPDFRTIYEGLISLGFLVELRSNGYLLNDDFVRWISPRKPHTLSVTIYGASDDTYKKVCGISDGFTRVTQNIEKLITAGIHVKTSMTVIRDNECDYYAVKAWAEERRIPFSSSWYLISPFENTGRSTDDLWPALWEKEWTAEDEIPVDNGIPESEAEKCFFEVCRLNGAQFTITWDGKMTPCTGIRYIEEDALNQPLDVAFSKMKEKMQAVRRPKKCIHCKYRRYCKVCPSSGPLVNGEIQINRNYCLKAKSLYMRYHAQENSETKNETVEGKVDCP